MSDELLLKVDHIENADIYQSDIDFLCDEYINTRLKNPDDINNTASFFGLLNYLYTHKFKFVVTRESNRLNYQQLDDIFNNIYIPLCSNYGKTITLQNFCVMVGIDNTYLSEIMSGTYKNGGGTITPAVSQTVKRWRKACESALYARAIETNSIGSIFGLKAAHGWKEEPQRIEITNGSQEMSVEQIAEKYAEKTAPMLPDSGE